ncbi:hypothetical protein QAD02_006396 [Eretmocerus hayati]|uniref:Uncharacterized protein n=1 Tax=Eretmocerus hayati TaxID=131215 RepID=A0ACC2N0T3_9HYME|nr:hypothetical protein QAD02_006396 [Eretmocerus hayati]
MWRVLAYFVMAAIVVASSLPQQYLEPRWGFEDDNNIDDQCKGWGSKCSGNDTCCSILKCSKKKGVCSILAGLWDDTDCSPLGASCSTDSDCCSNHCEQDMPRNWDFWPKENTGHCTNSSSNSTTLPPGSETTTLRSPTFLEYP